MSAEREQSTDVVRLTEAERALSEFRSFTNRDLYDQAAVERIVAARMAAARCEVAAKALRGQAAFFLAVDMDAAADHCEQAAIGWESQAVTDALRANYPPAATKGADRG